MLSALSYCFLYMCVMHVTCITKHIVEVVALFITGLFFSHYSGELEGAENPLSIELMNLFGLANPN